jgi:hypothetical protein
MLGLHPDRIVSDHARYLDELLRLGTLHDEGVESWREEVSEDGREARLFVTFVPFVVAKEPDTGAPLERRKRPATFVFTAAEADSFGPEFVLTLESGEELRPCL